MKSVFAICGLLATVAPCLGGDGYATLAPPPEYDVVPPMPVIERILSLPEVHAICVAL